MPDLSEELTVRHTVIWWMQKFRERM